METLKVKIKVWDPVVRVFHWALVLLVLGAFLSGEEYMNLHLKAGYGVLALVLFRIIWGFVGTHYARFSEFSYRPKVVYAYLKDLVAFKAKRYVGHGPAGGSMVIALILGLIMTAISGLALYGGGELAGPFAGLLAGTSPFWVEILEGLHEIFAGGIVFLVVLHVAGVLLSSFAHGENLIRSMFTGYKPASAETHPVAAALSHEERRMKGVMTILIVSFSLFLLPPLLHAGATADLLAEYQAKSKESLSAATGAQLWKKRVSETKSGQVRGCTTCHGDDLREIGKHKRTEKKIKPMAPSANPKRFTQIKFIEKWFKRNCKWAWGRKCTPTEKGHLLMFLKNQ